MQEPSFRLYTVRRRAYQTLSLKRDGHPSRWFYSSLQVGRSMAACYRLRDHPSAEPIPLQAVVSEGRKPLLSPLLLVRSQRPKNRQPTRRKTSCKNVTTISKTPRTPCPCVMASRPLSLATGTFCKKLGDRPAHAGLVLLQSNSPDCR
jgi:hypothetical protein